MFAALDSRGPEAVVYALFDALPFSQIVAPAFIVVTFISFATAMDSNTHSIANVCLRNSLHEGDRPRAEIWVKVFWGAVVGAVAFVMTSTTGIDGVRMLSNLGGLPGLFILIAMGAVTVMMRRSWFAEIASASQPAARQEKAAPDPARSGD